MMTRLAVVILLLIALAPVNGYAVPASDLASLVNVERRAAGLNPLATDPALLEVAGRHSGRMASEDRLFHNPRLAAEVSGWQAVGENVGRGPSPAELHRGFMHSPAHRAIILDPSFQGFGVAIAERDGTMWATELFVLRAAPALPVQAAAATVAPPRPAPPIRERPPVPDIGPYAAGPRLALVPFQLVDPPARTAGVSLTLAAVVFLLAGCWLHLARMRPRLVRL